MKEITREERDAMNLPVVKLDGNMKNGKISVKYRDCKLLRDCDLSQKIVNCNHYYVSMGPDGRLLFNGCQPEFKYCVRAMDDCRNWTMVENGSEFIVELPGGRYVLARLKYARSSNSVHVTGRQSISL